MAKKKTAKKAKEAPASKGKPSSMGWVIAAIVVIVIIAFLVLRPAEEAAKKEEKAVPTAPGGLQAAATPEMATKCLNAIGIVPGTKTVTSNVVKATFKNNGRTAIEATYFSFSSGEKTIYRKNIDTIQAGATISYSVDLNTVAGELGAAVKKFIVYPVESGKACKNTASVVIDY